VKEYFYLYMFWCRIGKSDLFVY